MRARFAFRDVCMRARVCVYTCLCFLNLCVLTLTNAVRSRAISHKVGTVCFNSEALHITRPPLFFPLKPQQDEA